MFEWVQSNNSVMMVTIYPSNLTLNSIALNYLNEIRWCMIGIDRKNFKMAIKPITKREIDLKIYPLENMHKVSIGKGYARISSKSIINEVSSLIKRELNGDKFIVDYDEKDKMLIVDLKKGG